MSYRFPWKKINNTIGLRIAAGYSLLMLLSFLALMVIAYFFLSATLARHDRDQVSVELQSLRAQYLEGGMDSFEQTVLKNDQFRKNNPFFTRVVNQAGQTVRIYFPQYWLEFDLAALENQFPVSRGSWMRLPSLGSAYELEILSEELPDGFRFQVGISTEDRETTLARLKETFLFAAFPLMVLGLSGGALLAHRSLRPVRHLVQTVAAINSGQLETRAPRTYKGDELDDLGRLFNEMLERIRILIDGMKNALDAVAHDLRTPMTRFRNLAENALQRNAGLQAYQDALQDCIEESDQILRMLNMLMDISEAETGTLQLNCKEVDFSALVGNVAEMYRYVAEEKGVEVTTSIAPHISANLDPERISQALANLLDNAVKYTPAGGRVELTLSAGADRVSIRVADTGIGIDSADMDRIWERLYRGRHDNSKGMGLGLSLVRAVVRAHGGDVTAQNRAEGGALFEINLKIGDPTKM
jgi:signal transduction histidine kinase